MRGVITPGDGDRPRGPSPIDHERGATLALTALSLVGILGMAALVVDVGVGRLARQSLIPATDSAALAAAQELVDDPSDVAGACAVAELFVADHPPAVMIDCDVSPVGPGAGRVTVSAARDIETQFAGVIGEDDYTVESVSAATWGPPLATAGLRSIALCHDGNATLQSLIDHPPSGPSSVRVEYRRDASSDCGGSPYAGNFASIDFVGGSSLWQIAQWLEDGYDDALPLDGVPWSGCTGDAHCFDRPWVGSDLATKLALLRDRGDDVLFPVYDWADDNEIHVIGAVRARIVAFDVSGTASNWFIELTVEPGLVTGTCCGPPGVLAGNRVIALCGVDPDHYDACVPETGP